MDAGNGRRDGAGVPDCLDDRSIRRQCAVSWLTPGRLLIAGEMGARCCGARIASRCVKSLVPAREKRRAACKRWLRNERATCKASCRCGVCPRILVPRSLPKARPKPAPWKLSREVSKGVSSGATANTRLLELQAVARRHVSRHHHTARSSSRAAVRRPRSAFARKPRLAGGHAEFGIQTPWRRRVRAGIGVSWRWLEGYLPVGSQTLTLPRARLDAYAGRQP